MNWLNKDILDEARETCVGRTYNQAAIILTEKYGEYITGEQLRSALRRSKRRTYDNQERETFFEEMVVSKSNHSLPDNLITVNEAPIHLEHESFMYASDFHVPFHDGEMLRRLLHLADTRYRHIDSLVVGGDFWDLSAVSFHLHDEERPVTIEEEMRIGGDIIYEMMQHWKHIYWLSGNHEDRIRRKLGAAFSLERLIYASLAGRSIPTCEIHVSNYDWMTAGNSWLMGHPSNFSGRGGQVPVDIALMKQRNTIGAHNHRFGVQATSCGGFVGIDPGCMTRGALHWYKDRRLNKYSEWVTGFVVVEDGFFNVFPGPFTNWQSLGVS